MFCIVFVKLFLQKLFALNEIKSLIQIIYIWFFFNYMRIKGINLVQDADDMVNLYLKICKAFEEASDE